VVINDIKISSYSDFAVCLLVGEQQKIELKAEQKEVATLEEWVSDRFKILAKYCRYPTKGLDSKTGNYGLEMDKWCKLLIEIFSHHHRVSYGISCRKKFEGIETLSNPIKNRSVRPEVKKITRWLVGEIFTYTSQLKERLIYLDPVLEKEREKVGGEDPLAFMVRKIVKFVDYYEDEVGEWLTPSLILDNYNHGNFGDGNLYDEYSIRTTKNQSKHKHPIFISDLFLKTFPISWLPPKYPDPPREKGRRRKKYDYYVCNFFDFIGACICGSYVFPREWKSLEKPLQRICEILYKHGPDLFRKKFTEVSPYETYLINALQDFEQVAFSRDCPISSWLTGKDPKRIPELKTETITTHSDEYYDYLWQCRRLFWQALNKAPMEKPRLIEQFIKLRHIDMLVVRDWCNSFEYKDQLDSKWATPLNTEGKNEERGSNQQI